MYREGLHLNQVEAGERCDVSQSTINKLESGKRFRPSTSIVRKLERGLRLPPGALETDPEPSPSLQAFLDSDIARSLEPPVSADEALWLAVLRWHYPDDEEPTMRAWLHLLEAHRGLRRK